MAGKQNISLWGSQMDEEFNYWEAIRQYEKQGYTKEEAEDLTYKDLMEVFEKACEIIDSLWNRG